ncbi:MAG: dodecin family protein [Deferrisomatales bacterium]
MAVASVAEMVSASAEGFDDAVAKGFGRIVRTLRNVAGIEVTDWRVSVGEDEVAEYRVTLTVTFLLEDTL